MGFYYGLRVKLIQRAEPQSGYKLRNLKAKTDFETGFFITL
jgi:hypothetical protein